jgi:hypothetical protein
LWSIEPLPGKDLETKEIIAVAMKRRCKHVSTAIKLLLYTVLRNPLLGRRNSWTTRMETGVFSIWSVPRSYVEEMAL